MSLECFYKQCDKMTIRQLNIHRVYSQASADEISTGLGWYKDAHQQADDIRGKLTVLQCAGIIAALSPGLRWENNIEAAERIIKGRSLKGLGIRWYDGVKKARRIKRGENPSVVVQGNKTRAFMALLANPDNAVSVCIDGHAYAIAVGRRIPLDEIPPITDSLYNKLSADYLTVARAIGILPCQLQAITWVTWRRLHGVTRPEPAPF